MRAIEKWGCETCGTEYNTAEDAAVCEAKGPAVPSVAVGDIVTCRAGFGWYNGDRQWIRNADQVDRKKQGNPGPIARRPCPNGDSNCFASCCTFEFYYVVTYIDVEPASHRPRYHLVTMAMSGKEGYRSGYTYDRGHCTPERVANPPAHVVATSKALLGEQVADLL